MSDPNAPAKPIIVNDSATTAVWATLLRYGITAIGAVLTALGYTGAAGKVSMLLLAVGPVATFGATAWGMWLTRHNNEKLKTLEPYAPDDVARAK